MNKITFKQPTLNDRNGDVRRGWYVEYAYRTNKFAPLVRKRVYEGLGVGTANDRYIRAQQIIHRLGFEILNGSLTAEDEKMQTDNLQYFKNRNRAQNADEKSLYYNINRYINDNKTKWNKKTLQCYVSKLRNFNRFVTDTYGDGAPVAFVKRQHIQQFVDWLAADGRLSRASVKKYYSNLKCFFASQVEDETIEHNPVTNIRLKGQIKDEAPLPFLDRDLKILHTEIEKTDAQLWLFCQLIYYCAIRPGNELRLLQLKHINFDTGIITIPNYNAKNNSTENVRCPDFVMDELRRYANLEREFYLFGSDNKPSARCRSVNYFSSKFTAIRKKLNLQRQYKLYSFKHTGIITALKNGINPYEIQQHCRHKHFETTELYIKKRFVTTKDNSAFFGRI